MAPHGPLYELTAAKVLAKVGAKATTGYLNHFLLSGSASSAAAFCGRWHVMNRPADHASDAEKPDRFGFNSFCSAYLTRPRDRAGLY